MEQSVDGDRFDQIDVRDRRSLPIAQRRPLDRIENVDRQRGGADLPEFEGGVDRKRKVSPTEQDTETDIRSYDY